MSTNQKFMPALHQTCNHVRLCHHSAKKITSKYSLCKWRWLLNFPHLFLNHSCPIFWRTMLKITTKLKSQARSVNVCNYGLFSSVILLRRNISLSIKKIFFKVLQCVSVRYCAIITVFCVQVVSNLRLIAIIYSCNAQIYTNDVTWGKR